MTDPELCRLCAESKANIIRIYDTEGQKLAIDSKITKCLHFQVLVTDDLPLSVCIDCYFLLNQYSEFYEKTNHAQVLLRRMLDDLKINPIPDVSPSIEPNINYIEKSEDFPKDEEYMCNSVNGIGDPYFEEDQANSTMKSQENIETEEGEKPSKCRNEPKKCSSKPSTRRRTKKKNQMQRSDDSEMQDGTSDDLEEGRSNDAELKSNVKIPENYMTGSESDLEIIEKRNLSEPTKSGRKKGDTLDRYPWLCTDCNDKLPSLESLEFHHQTVHNQRAKYMCVQCCKVYEKYYGFLTHVKRHRMKAKFNCEDCGKSFVHKKVMETHKAIHSEERPHICTTCGKAFRQQSALYIHSRCHLPETMKNRFPCDQCNKRFSTKPNLVTHKRIHSGVRNFTCDQCGKSFIQKGNLEAHFLTHSVDKPYTCTQCPKAFKTLLQLKKHETVHTGAKPHQCAVCGRTFREKGTLREHHRIHTGAMPFTCEFCGKNFRFKGILTTHRRQHTGERPYSCLSCQHYFTNWPNYNKHMKRRHGINTSQKKNLQMNKEPVDQQPIQEPLNHQENQNSLPSHGTPSSVQVIETVPHSSSPHQSQSIIVQAVPTTTATTTIETFAKPEVQGTIVSQDTVYQERNPTAYFNTVPSTMQTFLPSNLPYNFYNLTNVNENDLIQRR